MDVDRIMMSSDTHGSLLNRVSLRLKLLLTKELELRIRRSYYVIKWWFQVYELQCIREKDEATAGLQERADMEKLSLALTNMCQVEDKMEEGEEEEEECVSFEKYSQARARSDPVYILQQQQQQLQLQHQQQQNMSAFSSFVSHQQLCQPQQL